MICPKCGAFVSDDSLFCNYCGEKLNMEAGGSGKNTGRPVFDASEGEPSAEKPIRPRDEDFDITAPPRRKKEQETKPPKQNPLIILIIILVGALIGICGILLFDQAKGHQRTVVNVSTVENPTYSTESTEETETVTAQETAAETEETSEETEESTEKKKKKKDKTTEAESEAEGTSEETSAETTVETAAETTVQESPSIETTAQETAVPETTAQDTASEAVSYEVAGIIYLFENGTATLQQCYSADAVMELPSAADGCPITTIGPNAFNGCAHLEYIDLPEGIQSIAEGAFRDCVNLKEVVFPDSLTYAADDAFAGTSGVTIISNAGTYGQNYASAHGLNWAEGSMVTPAVY